MRNEILDSLEWFEVTECPEAFNCVYVWRNKTNGKIYVGQAKELHKRIKTHINTKDNLHFHNSLRKRGVEGYQLAIIIENVVAQEELDSNEKYYIKVLNSLNKNGMGYNCANGGEGGNTHAGKTEEEMAEFREKMSEVMKGKNAGENSYMYGKTGENHPMYGKKHSEEAKQKMSEAKKGKNTGENNPNIGNLIVQVDKATNEVVNIKYNFEFAKMGFDKSNISSCCKETRKTHKGYKWYYEEDYIKEFGEL